MHLISLGFVEATLTDNDHLTLLTRNRRQPRFPSPELSRIFMPPRLGGICAWRRNSDASVQIALTRRGQYIRLNSEGSVPTSCMHFISLGLWVCMHLISLGLRDLYVFDQSWVED